jgi:putative component of toxin-antitoxin plasmid stabilization module
MKNQPPIKIPKEELQKLYVEEKRSFRYIMKVYNFNSGRTLKRLLVQYGIDIRMGSEAVATQWINADERRKKTSDMVKNNPKFNEWKTLPKTEEFKKRLSKLFKGQPGKKGPDNSTWLGGKSTWAKGRKMNRKTRLKKIETLGNKCEKCGEGNIEKLTIHHDPPWRICRSHDLKYLHVLCCSCHARQPHSIR